METTTGLPVFFLKFRMLWCISSLAVTPPPGELTSITTATTLVSCPAWRRASASPSGVAVGPPAARIRTTATMTRPIRPSAMRPPTTKGHLRRLLGSPAGLSGCREGPSAKVSIMLPSLLCALYLYIEAVGLISEAAPNPTEKIIRPIQGGARAGQPGVARSSPMLGSGSASPARDVLQDVVLGGLG